MFLAPLTGQASLHVPPASENCCNMLALLQFSSANDTE